MTSELPTEFDEFRLVRRLGAGAMGEVYLAHDLLLDRPVAVKLIAAGRVSAHAAERFLVEARAAARVTHPNVAAIYRVGEIARRPYIISEFVRGTGLDRVDKPVDPARLLPLALGLARGLAAAHRRGVLHRDIKPANAIVADDGEVKLVDFGLAKLDAAGAAAESAVAVADAKQPPLAVRAAIVGGAAGGTLVDDQARGRAAAALDDPAFGTVGAALTADGALLGTPHYMAPECWRGEPATVRSDVYSLGALLFELASGRPPMGGVAFAELPEAVGRVDAPPLATVAPGVPARLCAIVDRCLLRDAAARFGSADAILDALEPLSAPRTGAPDGNPYRGLRPFEAEHRALFFGRAAETREVVERLRRESFVLLAGDSGVGKSSLARAGIVPAVREGALGGGRSFVDVTLMPGRDPEASLLAALSPWSGATDSASTLAGRIVASLGAGHGLCVFVDQLEELVTLARPESARAAAELLGALAAAGPAVRVLATVRGDFVTEVAGLPGLGELVGRALHVVTALSASGVRDAITRPLEHSGARFESDTLVDELVASTAAADGGLPLLQFALAELWEARGHDAVLSREALDAAGGVEAALARHADRVLASLLPRARAAARRVLVELVTAEGTRARRSAAELRLDDDAKAALDALVQARLVVAREVDGEPVYEVAHEALLARWETLRRWLEDAAGHRAVMQRLERAAAEWERLGRAREALWSARQLGEAALLDRSSLGPRERAFLDASARASRANRRRRIAVAIALPLAVAAAVIAQRTVSARTLARRVAADVAVAEAAAAEARALAPRVDRDVTAAFDRFDAADVPGGEEHWSRALAGRDALDRALGRAAQALETALMRDGSRADVRARLGAVLFDRARLADDAHRDTARDELVSRMGLYDDDGTLRARWSVPARVALDATPAATVRLARVVDDEGVRRVRDERELGTTPIAVELPPGDYLVLFRAPDRAEVRLPLVVERGETLPVGVALPPARAVPDGFVYVPRGRFLFGSADEANRRGFYNTTPLHAEETGAFYIARHETTFAEWIAWLETLPPAERERRVPHSSKGTFHGAVQLLRDGEHWRLRLTPNDVTYEAGWGERLRYRGRDRRIAQDWRHMPVSGVDWEDTVAYTRWLSSSGRVPGARPCSELEWERAARGADDREFPHGDRLQPDDADFDATYGKTPEAFGPDVVGAHPASQSPFGVDDLAGNVWEWTRSVLEPDGVVVRGGSYYYAQNTDRSINREPTNRALRDATLGVRVCADAR